MSDEKPPIEEVFEVDGQHIRYVGPPWPPGLTYTQAEFTEWLMREWDKADQTNEPTP